MRSTCKQSGFTITELMVVLAIAAVVMGFAIPSFNATIKSNRLTAATNEMLGIINFARAEAVRRGNRVHFAPTANSSWVVWVDGGDNIPDTAGDTEIRVWPAPPTAVSVTKDVSDTFFWFGGTGMPSKAVKLTICDDRTAETGSEISLLSSGAVNRSSHSCT